MFFFLKNNLMALGHFGNLNFIASAETWVVFLFVPQNTFDWKFLRRQELPHGRHLLDE